LHAAPQELRFANRHELRLHLGSARRGPVFPLTAGGGGTGNLRELLREGRTGILLDDSVPAIKGEGDENSRHPWEGSLLLQVKGKAGGGGKSSFLF